MKTQKIKAFTILEVVVTMAISAILVGITYASYRIISQSYLNFHAKNEELSTLERLDELLKKDFRTAKSIEKTDAGILMERPNDSIRYEFKPDAVVRLSSVPDTFKIKNNGPVCFFEGLPINQPASNDQQVRLDEVIIAIQLENEPLSLHYYKLYSSVNLYNREPDAID